MIDYSLSIIQQYGLLDRPMTSPTCCHTHAYHLAQHGIFNSHVWLLPRAQQY